MADLGFSGFVGCCVLVAVVCFTGVVGVCLLGGFLLCGVYWYCCFVVH